MAASRRTRTKKPKPVPPEEPAAGAQEVLPSDTPKDQERPLTEHLDELRGRILWSLLSVAVSSVVCYFFTDVFVHRMAQAVGPLVFLSPTEAFTAKMKIALILGLFFAVPVIIYHVWRYVGVALTVSERRVVLGALPFSYLLFAAGAALSWFLVVPTGLRFLMTFSTADVRPLISVQACLEFALWMTLGMGALFQIPVVIAALAYWGFVRAAVLARYRRHAALLILVLSAVVTPTPDVISQLLLALPTYLLFELSIVLARLLEPKEPA